MSTRIPTNDELIHELTEDLEKQCVEDDCDSTTTPITNIPEDVNQSEKDNEDNEEEDNTKTPTPPTLPEDYIDEEVLKEQETTLTEEELSSRHTEALQLKEQGNKQFRDELFEESLNTYTLGLRTCPLVHKNDRAILYCNRAAVKIRIKRPETAIDDCSKAIELNPNYQRAYSRRAALYEERDKLDEALEDYKKLLELDASNSQAKEATHRLPPLIQERNEKLKDEMLGKLKDLGNMFLKPFGLSTNNFKMQQDPNSGGYSINFQQ